MIRIWQNIGRSALLAATKARNAPQLTVLATKHVLETPEFLSNPLTTTQVRTFKDKDVLKLRCSACYFTKKDDRMWVLCNKHPRHKQRQKIEDTRMSYIVSHVQRTGSYLKKHYQYPYHDI